MLGSTSCVGNKQAVINRSVIKPSNTQWSSYKLSNVPCLVLCMRGCLPFVLCVYCVYACFASGALVVLKVDSYVFFGGSNKIAYVCL